MGTIVDTIVCELNFLFFYRWPMLSPAVRERQTDTRTDRQTYRQTDSDKNRRRQKETEREANRETETQRHRETEIDRVPHILRGDSPLRVNMKGRLE